MVPILLLRIGEQRLGLPLDLVQRVLPMAEVQELPEPVEGLLGVLNVHGEVLPVVDPHERLGVPRPAPAPEQRLLVVTTDARFLLWVDEVHGVDDAAPERLAALPQASSPTPQVLRRDDGLVPILAVRALEPVGFGP